MRRRGLASLVRERLRENPAVALLGPRQCGKTTLARSLRGLYFDLEEPADRLRLELQWDDLQESSRLLVLDEAQAWPEMFARLRSAIDRRRRKNGRFLVLGSVSPALMREVSESLAGRLALVELTPFLVNELADVRPGRLWCQGGYPDGGVLRAGRFPRWQRDYLTLLAQRDLPSWGLPARPEVTLRLLHMLAALHGQTWNASQIGQSLGLSHHTVNGYLDYLVGAYLVRRLPPYHANLRKRLVKSPKVYLRDTGLLHALLNVRDEADLLRKPWVGASFEGFAIEQVLGMLAQRGSSAQGYFLRTSDQKEIDLVLDFGTERWAVEVKLTASPSPDDLDRLDKVADLIDADRRVLISRTRSPIVTRRRVSCDLSGVERLLDEVAPPPSGRRGA